MGVGCLTHVGTEGRVVHERRGLELPGLPLVDAALPQGLPHALGDAAVGLAVDEQGLMARPTSSTDVYRATSTMPVSGSISTSHTAQP